MERYVPISRLCQLSIKQLMMLFSRRVNVSTGRGGLLGRASRGFAIVERIATHRESKCLDPDIIEISFWAYTAEYFSLWEDLARFG